MIAVAFVLAISAWGLWGSVGDWRTDRPADAGVRWGLTPILPGDVPEQRTRAAIPAMSVTLATGAIAVIAGFTAEGDRDGAADVLRWVGDVAFFTCIAGMSWDCPRFG